MMKLCFSRTALGRLAFGLAFVLAFALALAQAAAESRPATQGSTLNVVLTDESTVVLYRARREHGAIEGLVVDQNILLETLRARVIEASGLGEVVKVLPHQSARLGGEMGNLVSKLAPSYDFAPAYAFEHNFAEPFDSLAAVVALAPLGDDDEGTVLHALTATLALAIILGLYALYRMAAVQVRFSERRSNFVSAVSHELKTPLTAVRMYGEMLRDGMVSSEAQKQEYYETITLETERLSRLINNVLELSQLERDARPISIIVGDVGPVVQEVISVLRPHAEREGFQLVVEIEDDLPAAKFDRDGLLQIIFNLLDNAIKYGRDGAEKHISVRCSRTTEGGVQLSVTDRGPGVAQDQLHAIFDPFFRGGNELTRTKKGTGIGLALVHGLIAQMHGRVEGINLSPGFEVRVQMQGIANL